MVRSTASASRPFPRAALIGLMVAPLAALVSPLALGAFAQTAEMRTAETQPAVAQTTAAPISEAVRATLSQSGRFVRHATYGEVWIPTVTPADWRPYAACHWVKTKKLGWYYDDKSDWGAIVHHYGRWAHDARMGWLWVPGAEFSPGWVSWRSSTSYVGWAPLPPGSEITTVGTDGFDNAGFWTFMEANTFARGCAPDLVAPPAQTPVLLRQTTPVTDVDMVDGILIAVLPSYVVGPFVDIDVVFAPWSSGFLTIVLNQWNVIWNVYDIKVSLHFVACKTKISPIQAPGAHPPVLPLPPAPLPPASNPPPIRVVEPLPLPVPPVTVPPVRLAPPTVVVDRDPCGRLAGSAFRRCLINGQQTPPVKTVGIPPIKVGAVTGRRPPVEIRPPVGANIEHPPVRIVDPIRPARGFGGGARLPVFTPHHEPRQIPQIRASLPERQAPMLGRSSFTPRGFGGGGSPGPFVAPHGGGNIPHGPFGLR